MLNIGDIQVNPPIVQAALSGYSDSAMRRLAREYGCPYTINEVVLDRLVAVGGRRMRRMLAMSPDDHPVAGQLMGSVPEQFAEAAAALVEIGYDAIDVNFGCPVKKVLGRCRGGFLLSVPDQARRIVQAVCDAVAGRVPVTLKMRRGMDDGEESERHFFAILDAAFESGVAAVTVHGRTVKQRYVGPSDWAFLAKVKRFAGHRTIIGSGDLFTAEDCARMMHETGMDGCSIARGAIGNPFIFRDVQAVLSGRPLPPPPSIAEQRRAVERHFELMSQLYGARPSRSDEQRRDRPSLTSRGDVKGKGAVLAPGVDTAAADRRPSGRPCSGAAPSGNHGETAAAAARADGESKARQVFRKFGVRYSELHPCHDDVKRAFLAVQTADDWQAMLDRWYGDEHRYPPVVRRSRPETLIAAGAAWRDDEEVE